MTEFSDLSDDCLIEVLDRLSANEFKIQWGNKRLKRLANIKMQTNIKAIKLIGSSRDFTDCSHLGSIRRDQVLVLDSMFKSEDRIKIFEDPSKSTLFLSVVNKCAGVKSIDFDQSDPPFDVLLEVARRCPELECIKLNRSRLNKDEWVRILDEVGGEKILHFVKGGHHFLDGLLQTIAAKCNNIERLDWSASLNLTKNMLSAFKMLPKCCWISLVCEILDDDVVVIDVIDELDILELKWSAFDGRRYQRLSSLTFVSSEPSDDPFRGVDFAGLKKLDQQGFESYAVVDYFIASRFPRLEEFGFNVFGLAEETFDTLFKKISLVKKLTLHLSMPDEEDDEDIVVQLPQAAIHRLKNLETVVLDLWTILDGWQSDDFFQQLEKYIDDISSLKKLTVDTRNCICVEGQAIEITNRVEQIKAKKSRVEVDFIKGFDIMLE